MTNKTIFFLIQFYWEAIVLTENLDKDVVKHSESGLQQK